MISVVKPKKCLEIAYSIAISSMTGITRTHLKLNLGSMRNFNEYIVVPAKIRIVYLLNISLE
jgi:hypothetical protein